MVRHAPKRGRGSRRIVLGLNPRWTHGCVLPERQSSSVLHRQGRCSMPQRAFSKEGQGPPGWDLYSDLRACSGLARVIPRWPMRPQGQGSRLARAQRSWAGLSPRSIIECNGSINGSNNVTIQGTCVGSRLPSGHQWGPPIIRHYLCGIHLLRGPSSSPWKGRRRC